MKNKQLRPPSLFLSLFTVAMLMAMLLAVILIFRDDALNGAIQVVLLTATAIAALIAILHCRVGWGAIEERIKQNFSGIAPSILILLLIGSLAGSWMVSGIVPTLIYYGLKMLSSGFFLAACCVLCCGVSLITGSSWTTIATVGVALIGIGEIQGFKTGWIAGAIISGAYFGDKISPLSDTTVLAASVTETPLMTHVKYMLFTTVPSITIALIVFTIAGYTRTVPDVSQIADFSNALQSSFTITPWLLIVPVATGIMIAKKMPPVAVLFISSLLAGCCALIFQPHLLQEISGLTHGENVDKIKGVLLSFFGNTNIETGHAALNELVSTRGMAGMLNTVWLIICAMCFGGVMTAGGMIGRITALFLRFMKGRVSVVAAAVASGFTLNVCLADQYVAILLNGEMFKDVYKQRGFESRLLSRSTEDSVTVTSVLIPWSSCGMTQATVLGVPTLVYLPYCIFNIVSPFMSIIVAAMYKFFAGCNIRQQQ